MGDFGIQETTAYKVTRQVLDHIYGPDQEMTNDEFVIVFRAYLSRGGTWEGVMDDSIDCFKILEDTLSDFVNAKNISEEVNG
jgi:hypothetical protein